MAVENLGKTITIPAAGDLSAKQYRFMSLNSAGRCDVSGDGVNAEGVSQDDPSAIDQPTTVMVGHGITKVEAGASFSVNANLGSDSVGRAISTVTGDYIMGKAMEASTGAGQIIKMLFKPRGSVAP